MNDLDPVLVVGGTGNLGGRVVDALLARGTAVRALVRDGTDPGPLLARGAEVLPGDLLDPASLRSALDGARAVVTTAIGYLGRPRRRHAVVGRRRGQPQPRRRRPHRGHPAARLHQHPRRRPGH